jgi:anti-sigma factor RsiW
LNCRGVIRELSNYLDGDLDPQVKAELERHLEHCEDCKLVVDTTKKTVQVYCDTELMPLSSDTSSRLRLALSRRIRPGQS